MEDSTARDARPQHRYPLTSKTVTSKVHLVMYFHEDKISTDPVLTWSRFVINSHLTPVPFIKITSSDLWKHSSSTEVDCRRTPESTFIDDSMGRPVDLSIGHFWIAFSITRTSDKYPSRLYIAILGQFLFIHTSLMYPYSATPS